MLNLIVGISIGIAIGYYQPDMVADVAMYVNNWIKSI
jgi:hypothetical protein